MAWKPVGAADDFSGIQKFFTNRTQPMQSVICQLSSSTSAYWCRQFSTVFNSTIGSCGDLARWYQSIGGKFCYGRLSAWFGFGSKTLVGEKWTCCSCQSVVARRDSANHSLDFIESGILVKYFGECFVSVAYSWSRRSQSLDSFDATIRERMPICRRI